MTTLNVFGESIQSAGDLAKAKFLACPWHFFDGVPDKAPNDLVWGDFAITRVMNSGVNDGFIPERGEIIKAKAILARIPRSASLAKSNAPLEDVRCLFSALRAHHFGRSRIAKVLCRKRPSLIPMLDGVVTDFLFKIARKWVAGKGSGGPPWFADAWSAWDDPDDPTVYLRMVREALVRDLDAVRAIRARLASTPATSVPSDASLLRIWEAALFWHLWSR